MYRILLLCLAVFMLQACASHWRAQAIEEELLALQAKVDQLKEQQKREQAQHKETIEYISKEIENRHQEVLRSIDSLKNASVGDKLTLDELQEEVKSLKGQSSELKHEIEKRKSAMDAPTSDATSNLEPLPEDKDSLYIYALEKKKADQCRDAIRGFTAFIETYTSDARMDDSLYHLAECYHRQNRYEESTSAIQKLMTKYADKDQADSALLLLYKNYMAVDKCKDALKALVYLQDAFPRSPHAKNAKKLQDQLNKTCKK
jgi:TolA-binding protein